MRHCKVCVHPERTDIEKALIKGESYREISLRFSLSIPSIFRHYKNHLAAGLAKAREIKELVVSQAALLEAEQKETRDEVRADILMGELSKCIHRVNLIYSACDEYLRDVEDPEKYDIGPRSEDVMVTYFERVGDGGKEIRRKRKLSAILADLNERDGLRTEFAEIKHADPRELALKALSESRGQLALLVDVQLVAHNVVQSGRFQEEVLSFIDELDPGLKKRFLDRLAEKRMFQAAISPPGGMMRVKVNDLP